MTTNFPQYEDTYTTKVNNVTVIDANHINDLQDAILQLEKVTHHGIANLFINGGFDIWQRTTNDTGVTTTRKYVADRWAVKTGAGTLANVRRSTSVRPTNNTDLVRSRYSCELIGAAGVTTVSVDQRIESAMSGRYKRTLYFTAWIYNGSGADFIPKIYLSTPSAADNWASSTVRNGGGSGENLQTCINAGWTLVSWSGNVSGYINIDNGLEVRIEIPSGSLVAGDTVRFCEMSLTPLAAMPFVMPNIQQELAKCQRYYQRHGLGMHGVWGSATIATLNLIYPVQMRISPTLALLTATPVINEVFVASRVGSGSTISSSIVNKSSLHIQIDGFSGATAQNGAQCASDELISLDAEL